MIESCPLESLRQAWETYKRVHFPALAPRTRIIYAVSMRKALEDLPDPLTHASLLEWHRVTLPARYTVRYANASLHVLRTVSRRAAPVTGDTRLQALIWGVGALREPPRVPRCPPSDFMRKAMPFCRNSLERLWLGLACLAGLRRGELLGLMPSDYERETMTLRVVRQRRSPTRKNRRPHAVKVDAPELRLLLEQALELPRGGRYPARSFLFPWGYNYAMSFLERLRAGLGAAYLPKGAGWHVCRHWGATELARSGASIWEIMAWLGDASPEVAARYVDMVRGLSVGGVRTLAARQGPELFGPQRTKNRKGRNTLPGEAALRSAKGSKTANGNGELDGKPQKPQKPPITTNRPPTRKRPQGDL